MDENPYLSPGSSNTEPTRRPPRKPWRGPPGWLIVVAIAIIPLALFIFEIAISIIHGMRF